MPSTTTPRPLSLQDRLIAALKSDPKKSGILTLLVTILLMLWVRMWAGSSQGPAEALAASSSPTPAVGGTLLHTASADTNVYEALQTWKASPIPPMGRNLFAPKLDYFPRDGFKAANSTPAPQMEAFWDRLAKSMAGQTDQRKERQVLIENLQAQAAKLRLQTTVMGARPRAVINQELVSEGDVVASFRVLKIEARRVIVEREGIKLEILMR